MTDKQMEFTVKDSPDANGRKPVAGEQRYTLTFPLDSGEDLKVHMGKESVQRFAGMIAELMVDEHAEANT
jgi:hypothetical protein